MSGKNKAYAEDQVWSKAKHSPSCHVAGYPNPCLPISFVQITQSSKGRDHSEQKTLGKGG